MNRYGNKYGYHSVEMTKNNFRKIEGATGISWIDSSWKNDGCDSMHHKVASTPHKYIELYLPNSESEDTDNEEYNTFSLIDEEARILINTEDRNEVINFILKNYK
jgi:hypothetical protein